MLDKTEKKPNNRFCSAGFESFNSRLDERTTMQNPPQVNPAWRGSGLLTAVSPPEPDAPRNKGALDDEILEALAESMWEAAIAEVPSLLGRIEFLARLRNFKTGGYEHYGLELALGSKAASEVPRRAHVEAFLTWLRLDLVQKTADVAAYLSGRPGTRRQVFEEWQKTTKLLRLAPEAASAEERGLFLLDIEVVAEVLAADYKRANETRSLFAEALLRGSERLRSAEG